MILAVVILLSAVVINGQEVLPVRDYRLPYYYNYDESPKPYSFSYTAPLEDGVGHSARTEVADGSGKVEGSYTVTNDEGHTRVVDYVADEGGFRASIRTNEPGTDNKNPADVVVDSSAPFSYSPYQYTPRRPAVVTTVDPTAAPVQPVEVVPQNIVAPVQPAFYNLPNLYRNRNPAYRPHYRNRYNRNPYYRY